MPGPRTAGTGAVEREKRVKREKPASRGTPDVSRLEGARRAALPSSVQPALCTLVDDAPEGDEWIHEVKFDGYRIVARVDAGRVRLLSRNGKDWTSRFAGIARAVGRLPLKRAMLDGEVCVVEADGTTSFQALQNALGSEEARDVTYFLFDLMHLDDRDLRRVPLVERKRILASLLGRTRSEAATLRYSDHVVGHGREFHREACVHGLEGIISKLAASPYREVRSKDWRKIKCLQEQEFVIAGYTDGTGTRTGFGALLLGVHEKGGALRYAGKVGTGFTEESLRQLSKRLGRIGRRKPAFEEVPVDARHGVHWVEPRLVAEVAFLGWTREGRLRQPSFHGLREDRPAREVVREVAARLPAKAPRSSRSTKASADRIHSNAAASKALAGQTRAAGIAISNASKILFPVPGISKGELAAYYEMVGPWMLPHVAGRPLTLVRCPDGYEGPCFFQKNAAGLPREVERVRIPDPKGGAASRYGVVRDAAGLVALLQMGVLEFHIWGSTAAHLECPDRIAFDLDPGPGVCWPDVIVGAHLVRATLQRLGLSSVAMLTGGKGLHVVLFVEPEYDWAIVKEFAHAVVKTIVRGEPKRYTDHLSKGKRNGRIFLDYLRNGRGATAVAPYSTRARPGAPVAVPIDWKELDEELLPNAFAVRSLEARLGSLRADPWKRALATRQSLRHALEGRRAAQSATRER